MTEKQMVRVMKKYGISLIFDRAGAWWYAGECFDRCYESFDIKVEHNNSIHSGRRPETAVEDYCNARDLKWDV